MSPEQWERRKLELSLEIVAERRAASDAREKTSGELLHAASCGAAVDWRAAVQARDDARADEFAALRVLAERVREFLAGGSR